MATTAWRRVLVPADIRLHQLHLVIQVAMGWTNSHLHAFELREWAGGDFDPEAFDLVAVNAELARFIKLRR